MLDEEKIEAIVRARLRERREMFNEFSQTIIDRVEELIVTHWRNAAGLDINDQKEVNKFNQMIKFSFDQHRKAVEITSNIRTKIVNRLSDFAIVCFCVGFYHYFMR